MWQWKLPADYSNLPVSDSSPGISYSTDRNTKSEAALLNYAQQMFRMRRKRRVVPGRGECTIGQRCCKYSIK